MGPQVAQMAKLTEVAQKLTSKVQRLSFSKVPKGTVPFWLKFEFGSLPCALRPTVSRPAVLALAGAGRESWLGPAEFVVRAAAPEVRSGTAQSVQPIDPALGEQLQSLPLLIQRAERAGNATRGQDKGPDPRSLLDAEELAAVEAAQKRFEGMRAAWPHQDPLPYIYYAAVLEQYGLDAESNAILREARARCPLCDLPALSSEE